jgi:hypothetical protein
MVMVMPSRAWIRRPEWVAQNRIMALFDDELNQITP